MKRLLVAIENVNLETDECVEWPGFRTNIGGYGQVQFRGRLDYAHRVAFMLHRGPIPDGKEVCHTCDNPPCFNPRHLFAGTRRDNMQDSLEKGRHFTPRGELSGRAILTDALVKTIRNEYRPGVRGYGHKILARKYGVAFSTMRAVLSRRSWEHV